MNMRLTDDVFKWIPNTEAMKTFSEICKDVAMNLPPTTEEGINFIQFVRMTETYHVYYENHIASGLFVDLLDYICDHVPTCWIGLIGDPVSHLSGNVRIVAAENEGDALSTYDGEHTNNAFILGRLILLGDENESTSN